MDRLFTGRLFALLGLLLWATLSVSFAQQPPLRFEHQWGQSANVGYSLMLQDRKGFLWFTFDGLVKYDGHRFTHYRFDPLDSTSLSSNFIWTIWQDSTGLIWVGTDEAACRFDPRSETLTRLERNLANPFATKSVTAFNEDREGHLWTSGQQGELRMVDRQTGRFSATDYAPLLGTVSDSSKVIKQLVRAIYRDKAGTLWLGTLTGLYQFILTPQGKGKPSKVSFAYYRHDPANARSISHNEVRSIYEDRKGVLWIGTNGGGLNTFDRNTGAFTRYQHDPNNTQTLSDNLISWHSIAEDPQPPLGGNGEWPQSTQPGAHRLYPLPARPVGAIQPERQ